MREIKFRAFIKSLKGTYDVLEITPTKIGISISDSGPFLYPKDDVILEQYTGLKDKKDIEIFEHDIVLLDGFNPKYYIVEFIEGAFCFTNPIIEDYPIDINMVFGSTGPNIEVISNSNISSLKEY